MLNVPYFQQNRDFTCGPACLRMVLAYYRIEQDEVTLTMLCRTNLLGTTIRDLAEAARAMKLEARYAYFDSIESIQAALEKNQPVIVAVDAGELYGKNEYKHQRHMVVIVEVSAREIQVQDPHFGAGQLIAREVFERAWESAKREIIILWQTK